MHECQVKQALGSACSLLLQEIGTGSQIAFRRLMAALGVKKGSWFGDLNDGLMHSSPYQLICTSQVTVAAKEFR